MACGGSRAYRHVTLLLSDEAVIIHRKHGLHKHNRNGNEKTK